MKKRRHYFPALDSIRGLAFLSVFIFHTVTSGFNDGFLGRFLEFLVKRAFMGIDVFFVLSSFLLTYLGLKEYQEKGTFSSKSFFIRRALRIWPLYYLMLGFSFWIMPFLARRFGFDVTLPEAWYYVFFVSNFYTVDHVFYLRFLWTISIEEQFYLLLSAALTFLKSGLVAFFTIITGLGIIASLPTSLSSYTVVGNLLVFFLNFGIGGLLAMMLFQRRTTIPQWMCRPLSRWIFWLALPTVFISWFLLEDLLGGDTMSGAFTESIGRIFFVCWIGFLIMLATNKKFSPMLSDGKWLIFTGKISYGLYVYHGIAITMIIKIFGAEPGSSLVYFLITLLLTYLMAAASYFLIEKRILGLKKWFR